MSYVMYCGYYTNEMYCIYTIKMADTDDDYSGHINDKAFIPLDLC